MILGVIFAFLYAFKIERAETHEYWLACVGTVLFFVFVGILVLHGSIKEGVSVIILAFLGSLGMASLGTYNVTMERRARRDRSGEMACGGDT